MKTCKRILRCALALACIVLMIPLSPVPASAASKTVYVSDMMAQVYKKASTSSAKMGKVSFGEKLTCTAVSSNWAKVKNSSGKTGFMKKSTLTTSNPNTYNKKIYIQKSGLKVYAAPSTSSKKIANLKLGSGYTAVAKSASGQWLRIKNGKYYGYVKTIYTDTEPYKKGTKVYMTQSSIAVASAPGAFDSIGSLSLGQSCWLLEKKSNYVKVRSDSGMVGYIHDTTCLSEKNPNTLNKKMYIQASKAPYYPHAFTRSRSGTLSKNTVVTAVARQMRGNMEWYRVKYNNKYYYIPGILLAESKVPSGGRTVYAIVTRFSEDQEGWLSLYEKPDLSSKQIAKVTDGEKLTLVSCKGTGVRVRTSDGKLGYVLPTQLKKSA